MTATEELRRLLDERGVKYRWDNGTATWYVDGVMYNAWGYDNERLTMSVCHLTPEQAIAATLGPGTCHDIGGCRWFRCSACGFGIEDMYVNDEDEYPPEDQPRYCPNCGRLVVEVTE